MGVGASVSVQKLDYLV